MKQYLPVGKYRWEWNPQKFEDTHYLNSLQANGDRGYMLMVDLDVPEKKHDHFNDYPPAPQMCCFEDSPYMQEYSKEYGIKQAKTEKLIPNLFAKKRYIVHYRTLQLYLSEYEADKGAQGDELSTEALAGRVH